MIYPYLGNCSRYVPESFSWRANTTGLNGPAHLAAFPCFFLRLPRFLFTHPRRDGGLPAAVVDQAVRPRIRPKQRSASKSWLVTSSFFFSAPSVAGVRRPAAMASPRERRLPPPAFRMENPFSVKVLQVFTGFGVGCGVGIGVGRPIYLGNEFCRTLSSFLSKE